MFAGFHKLDNLCVEIKTAFDEAKTVKGMPTVIIARTVKGKGVSSMENNYKWHGSE